MESGKVSIDQVVEWALNRDGRLQCNAIYMLRYSRQPEAIRALTEISRHGPQSVAPLADQSLRYLKPQRGPGVRAPSKAVMKPDDSLLNWLNSREKR